MFDDVLGMARQCAETFRDDVRDAFGASIMADVLEPICHEIGFLSSFHEEFQSRSATVGLILQEARSLSFEGSLRG